MVLNSRCIEILKKLNREKNRLEELSEFFKVSTRLVRYDFENINFILKNLKQNEISKDRDKKFFLEMEENLLKKIIEDFSELSSEERKEYLLFKILLKGELQLSEEGDILESTRDILRNDIKKISEETGFNIKFITGKGCFLIDDEEKIRDVFYNKNLFFMENIDKLKEPMRTLFLESSKNSDIYSLKKIIEERVEHSNEKLIQEMFSLALEKKREKENFLIDRKISNLLRRIKEELKLKSEFSKKLKSEFSKELEKAILEIYNENRECNFFKISKKEILKDEEYLLSKVFKRVEKEFPELFRDFSLMISMKIRENIISQESHNIRNKNIVLVSSMDNFEIKKIARDIKRVFNTNIPQIVTPFMYYLSDEKKNSIVFTTEELKVQKDGEDEHFFLETNTIENYFTLKLESMNRLIFL